ncbi:MAG TPA: ABC transporter permease [Anaerolineae bacterium]|mgnify:CR=1 FL=1|nr:ABC transporter permease [Anaerolineae bacterium]
MITARRQLFLEIVRIVVVVILALLLGFFITSLVSEEPVDAYTELLTGPFPRISLESGFQIRGLNRFGNWLEESITLILLGLSVSIAFRARQFSLGAEGQLFLGALATGFVGLLIQAPLVLHLGLGLLAAGIVGFIWGLIPGVLKAYLNADEIVSTLMLNVIAVQLYQFILFRYLRDPTYGYIATPFFPETALLPLIIPGTRVSIMLFVMIAAVVAVWFLMTRTPLGYEIKILGANRRFAEYGGINSKRVISLAMAVSGIFAGLAGAHLSMGLLRQLTLNLSPGIGFEGIVVALLARNNPKAVPVAGLFYAYLRTGAQIMERSSDVTREVVLIIQAIIILFVTAERILPLVQQWWQRRRSPDVLLDSAEAGAGGGQ